MTNFTLTPQDDNFPTSGLNNSGDDYIDGGAGQDLIHGGTGHDEIHGGSDDDTLFGDRGNDTIYAGLLPLNDVLDGGLGFDSVILVYENVINLATTKSVSVVANFSQGAWATLVDGVVAVSLSNFERIQIDSGDSNDNISGGSGDDVISSKGGNDILSGGAGNDRITDTWGVYNASGGIGQDTLAVSSTNLPDRSGHLVFDAVAGTISSGTATSGSFSGFEAYDVSGTQLGDIIVLGRGNDSAIGGDGRDKINGGEGRDFLAGGSGADRLLGGLGNDELYSGEFLSNQAAQANDTVSGGAGNDLLFADTSSAAGPLLNYAGAVFDGGAGIDRLEIESQTATADLSRATIVDVESFAFSTTFQGNVLMTAAQVNGIADFSTYQLSLTTKGRLVMTGNLDLVQIRLVAGGQSIDLSGSTRVGVDFGPRILGGVGNDRMIGSVLRDSFAGSDGSDNLQGGAGNDLFYGGGGNDTVLGGADNDLIFGEGGVDVLTGDAGSDTFYFRALTDSGLAAPDLDTVTDFTLNPDATTAFVDRIDLVTIDAKAGVTGNDSFTFVGLAGFTAEGQVRAVQSGADTLLEFNTSGTSGAEMVVKLLTVTATALTASDFVL